MSEELKSTDGVIVLPDGSAFATASFPLPKDHWLYAPRGDWDSVRDDFAETPLPILTNAQRDAVIAAGRYAVRGATMCGKEADFDPDALVRNLCYALCGPANAPMLLCDAPQPEPAAPPEATLDQMAGKAWDRFQRHTAELQALENCRLYAARHRKEDWAATILRFCADGGATGSPLREAAPTVVEPLHVDESKRYRVVQKGYWWRVQIGDGQQTVGRCFSQTEAQQLAHALLVAYRDGAFVASRATPPRAALTDEQAEALIESSDGRWHEDEFRIDSRDLMALLRKAHGIAASEGGAT